MKKLLVTLLVLVAMLMSNLVFAQTHSKHHKAAAHHRTTLHNAAHHKKVAHHATAHHKTVHHKTVHHAVAKHHKPAHHAVTRREVISVNSRSATAEVEIKNGNVFVNDDPVLKIKSLKNEDDKIMINYTAPPPAPAEKINDDYSEYNSGQSNDKGKAALGVSVRAACCGDDGAMVDYVTPCSPAHDAGFYYGDVITKVDGHAITNAKDLVDAIDGYRPGDKVTVTYIHLWRETTAEVTLADKEEMKNGCCNGCWPSCYPWYGHRWCW